MVAPFTGKDGQVHSGFSWQAFSTIYRPSSPTTVTRPLKGSLFRRRERFADKGRIRVKEMMT
ncbi:hypothetical protein A8B83_03865 [Rhodobacteraceae bacterium EhC02]|nr:hypothetical protein A8B83_03865 [Rhodobacteraceae bacterium EhC02]